MSEFQAWLTKQFGKRPSEDRQHQVEAEIEGLEKKLYRLREELRAIEHYRTAETAARYAWTARDKQ